MGIVEAPAAQLVVSYTEVREELQSRLRHHEDAVRIPVDPAPTRQFNQCLAALCLVRNLDFDPLHSDRRLE